MINRSRRHPTFLRHSFLICEVKKVIKALPEDFCERQVKTVMENESSAQCLTHKRAPSYRYYYDSDLRDQESKISTTSMFMCDQN